ncbi:MAG TPA: TatD family hydrolase [Bacteroidales bacterium]|nr:TatD family hydrolase [Bacteroidales bacterium]
MLIDIHTHDSNIKPGQIKVLSIQLHPDTNLDEVLKTVPNDILISAGVHPWDASEWTTANFSLLVGMLLHPRIAFIGEIGLDKACTVPLEDQFLVFELQLKLAEKFVKSVLIHMVGSQAELIATKRKFKVIPLWIIHGFRGKAAMARQMVKSGFSLSFGQKYHSEALLSCPLDKLFLETDVSNTDLRMLYKTVAKEFGVTIEYLEKAISQNAIALGVK